MVMQLQDKNGVVLQKGDPVWTFRGGAYILCSWTPPHKPEASGYVYIRQPGETREERYYPGVIDAKFVEVS